MQVRYRLYGEWDKEDESIPMVLAARQTAKVSTFCSKLFTKESDLTIIGLRLPLLTHIALS